MRTPLLLALATLSLAAQDRYSVALEAASQTGRSQSLDFHDDKALSRMTFTSERRTQFGLEAGWKALSLNQMDLRLTAGLRLKAKADIQGTLVVEVGGNPGLSKKTEDRVGTLDHQSLSLGAEVTWHLPLEVGAGLQVRREHLTSNSDEGGVSFSGTTVRPWLTAHAGWSWKTQGLTPFVRGQAALPLTQSNISNASDQDKASFQNDLVKSLAPKFELGLQVGLRF